MKIKKLLCATTLVAFAAISTFAQRSEKSVEDEYLSSVEDVIISEMVATSDYDNMLVALEFLEESVSNGRSSPEMIAALSSLAGEGLTTVTRRGGRIVNNYPDVRARACKLLGELPSEESKITLVQVIQLEKEPMVLSAAVHALGDIGINDDDEVVNAIEFVHNNMSIMNPTSSFANEVLYAYEKLAPTVQDRGPLILSISSIASNYRYVQPVRDKAKELLKSLQNSGSQQKVEK